jgi:alkaline phosphatase D
MTRKEFLLTLPATALLPAALAADPQPAQPTPAPKKPAPKPLTLPPVQPGPPYLVVAPQLGHVTHNSARLWVRATAAAPLKVRLVETANADNSLEFTGPELKEETVFTGFVDLTGLKPSASYRMEVTLGGQSQLASPLPVFTTAPAPGTALRQRIALGSCVGDSIAAAAPAWAELAARREMGPQAGGFDLLLMLGDNHYGNTTDLQKHRVYYTAHRLSAGWRELAPRVPIYAIWDDHDFGTNNSDTTQNGKENSLVAFMEFWGNPGFGEPDNPGCYYTFTRGDVQFFMLDCRYYRSPDKAPVGPDKTMLGAKQIEWLKRELLASKAKIKLLATGSEWETFSSDDSWKMYLRERNEFFDWVEQQKLEGIILLSGDRHFSSAYHVRGHFLELSGGPFGSGNAKLKPNPERMTGWDEGRLWFVLDLDTTTPEPKVAYELWQAGGGRLERREVTWAQINGREKMEPSKPPKPPRMEERTA